jgi:hypothetical protein
MITGMTDNDTRRHYYDLSLGYPIRFCTRTFQDADDNHLVPMPNVEPDCKNCRRKYAHSNRVLPATGGK